MEIVFILFAISFPVFYILGAITFFKWVLKIRDSGNQQSSKQLSNELTHQIIKDTKEERREQPSGKKELLKADLGQAWNNWYSDNSINLLLYIGAFLIVASASIFVGFSWEMLGGALKASVLSLITLGFFVFGGVFYKIEKIKSAGSTFLAVAAILIPFNGAGWYNFYLQQSGFDFGYVWTMTSIVAVLVYIMLAFLIRHPFYTYIASAGGLSLLLSFVNVSNLQKDYYILGGIVFSFVLLLASRIFRDSPEQLKDYGTPLTISAQFTMPISLMFGFYVSLTENNLFTIEAGIASILAALYYFLVFSIKKEDGYLAISLGFVPVAAFIFGKYLKVDERPILYLIDTIFLFYLFSTFKNSIKKEIQEILFALSLGGAFLVVSAAIYLGFGNLHLAALALIAAIFGYLASFKARNLNFSLFSLPHLMFAIVSMVNAYLNVFDNLEFIGYLFTVVCVVYYLAAAIIKARFDIDLKPLVISIAVLGAAAFILSITDETIFLGLTFIIFLMAFDFSKRFSFSKAIYIGNLSLYFSLWSIFRIAGIDPNFLFVAWMVLSIGFYLIYKLTDGHFLNEEFRNSALIGTGIVAVIAFITAQTGGSLPPFEKSLDEYYAIVCGYLALALYGIDAYSRNDSKMGYFASGVGLFVYLWQARFLGFSETQIFTLPTGVYFMTLAYLQRLNENHERRQVLDFIGLGFLLVPTFYQSLGNSGWMYALALGAEGLVIFIIGNSLKYKTYIYAGIASFILAIFSQSYEYLFSLPRYLITAIGGLVFIAVAIFLMIQRGKK